MATSQQCIVYYTHKLQVVVLGNLQTRSCHLIIFIGNWQGLEEGSQVPKHHKA